MIGLAIKYWYIAVPLGIVLLILFSRARRRSAEKKAAAHQAWLSGPPPPLVFPGRFTSTWFANQGPYLHPGQVPALLAELRRRGWSEADIAARAAPYLPSSSS